MEKKQWGGKREGAGRKKTGKNINTSIFCVIIIYYALVINVWHLVISNFFLKKILIPTTCVACYISESKKSSFRILSQCHS